jgi:immune inhibitor A
MSSGANIGDGSPDGIGDAPTDMGAWEKFQLGWLGCPSCPGGAFYQVAHAGDKTATLQLGPNDAATKKAQALIVTLPDRARDTLVVAPKTGTYAYWSGMGDNFSHSMTKPVTYAAGSTLTADLWYDTEPHFDYVFLEVSHDNGTTWEPVNTNLSEPASADEGSFNSSGTGIAGSSGGVYKSLTASLPGSGAALVRWRYETDANTGGKGAVVDNMVIGGNPVDGAESDADRAAWTYDGFQPLANGIATTKHFNAYIAENRQHDGYDASLATAYNFGFLNTKPDWVETYPYQPGMLVTYWDESFSNNNVGEHPGGGLALPVDAHPSFEHWASDGQYMRQRIQAFDSTFGLARVPAITLHKDSVATTIGSKAAVPAFDDTKTWWYATDGHTAAHEGRYQVGWTSVDVPNTGTTIKVLGQASGGKYMTISVGPSS